MHDISSQMHNESGNSYFVRKDVCYMCLGVDYEIIFYRTFCHSCGKVTAVRNFYYYDKNPLYNIWEMFKIMEEKYDRDTLRVKMENILKNVNLKHIYDQSVHRVKTDDYMLTVDGVFTSMFHPEELRKLERYYNELTDFLKS
jgi:hypothetical protein